MAPSTAALAISDAPQISPIERETMARVTRRLVPLLMICYFAAYLDRVNVGFAALSMNDALGFSSAVFGFGSGIFFIGYFLFEVPSNIILSRVGARRWIARIMITWGVISAATAFVTGPISFYSVRFLLGLAEAGFFPGIILYLTWWFPSYYRSRIIGMFMAAIPVSVILGSLVSSTILGLDGWLGIQGWKWLFLVEAIPPVILGLVVYLYLTDHPAEARWLAPEQRQWLTARLEAEQSQRESIHHFSLGEALRNPRVLGLTLVYFGQNMAGYGLVLFLPQIVSRFGGTPMEIGLVTAIPYVFGAVAMILWGLHSDRTGERSGHVAIACLLCSFGLIACLTTSNPYWMMTFLILAQMGQSSIAPTFWSLPTAMLSGTAAAGGIAFINAVGNLGGFAGPYVVGLIQDATGSFSLGLAGAAMGTLVGAVVVWMMGHDRRLERIPAQTLRTT